MIVFKIQGSAPRIKALHPLLQRDALDITRYAYPVGKKLKVYINLLISASPFSLLLSLILLVSFPPSLSLSGYVTHHLPSLMSARRTWGPRVSVQFLFWHPFLITHVNDWSPGLGRGGGDGSPGYTMALPLRPSSGRSLRCWGRVEPDTCNGPRAVRLSSEHPAFGPKTLPIDAPWGASCAGAARYLWPFVWSNPSQL